MKKLILLIICLGLAGCSESIFNIQSTPTYPDLEISMERGPCFGTCPIYTLIIHANGTVNYEGEAFVQIEGTRNAKISPDQIDELVTAIENADFFSLEDQYRFLASDLPSITLSITLDGRSKSIWHYGSLDCGGKRDDAPEELCELESKIDEVVNSSQWVKQE